MCYKYACICVINGHKFMLQFFLKNMSINQEYYLAIKEIKILMDTFSLLSNPKKLKK